MYRAYPIPYKCVLNWQRIVDVLTNLHESFAAFSVRIIFGYTKFIPSGDTKNILIQRYLKGKLLNVLFFREIAYSGKFIWVRTAHLEYFDFYNRIPDIDTDTFIRLAVFWPYRNIDQVLFIPGCRERIFSFFRRELLSQFTLYFETGQEDRLY